MVPTETPYRFDMPVPIRPHYSDADHAFDVLLMNHWDLRRRGDEWYIEGQAVPETMWPDPVTAVLETDKLFDGDTP